MQKHKEIAAAIVLYSLIFLLLSLTILGLLGLVMLVGVEVAGIILDTNYGSVY